MKMANDSMKSVCNEISNCRRNIINRKLAENWLASVIWLEE